MTTLILNRLIHDIKVSNSMLKKRRKEKHPLTESYLNGLAVGHWEGRLAQATELLKSIQSAEKGATP